MGEKTLVSRVRRTVLGPALTAAVALLCFGTAAGAAASGGIVKGWGFNEYGAVGVGSLSESVDTPTPLLGLSGVAQVAGGRELHGLAVLTDGTVKAWGSNAEGQLGNGTTEEHTIAGAVPGLANVVEVAAGEYHSIALLSNGRVMAWGYNGYGQLGLGSASGPQTCGGACSTTPVEVPGITEAVAVGATEYSSFAVLANGTVMGWGGDRNGELGDGIGIPTGCACVPTPVAIPGVSGAIAIDGGEASAVALLADGRVMTWGYNDSAQAGNGTQNLSGCRCAAPAFATGIATATDVAAGEFSDLALLANGTVMGWGANDDAQLATGSTEGPEGCDPGGFACSRTPIPVGGLSGVRGIGMMGYTDVALLNDGTARSWGGNGSGELGNGTHGSALATTPMPVSNVTGASAIGPGEYMGFALIGPSQTLSIAFAGAGSGSVRGREVSCPPRCSGVYPQGQVALLTATPSGFAGFSGACTGTGVCQAKMDSDQTVTATFGVPTGTRITEAKIVNRKKKATFSFTAPGAITGYECLLIKPKAKKKHKRRKHKTKASRKATKATFASCQGPKTYTGLRPGKYTFEVRALDIFGADANPAQRVFKIKAAKKKRKRR
jgi:alpha-tubulin suppressor-like RCC1 family protein